MFAHGYQALVDGAEALYQVSEFYTPGVEQGLRYDDPALGIKWPLPSHGDLRQRSGMALYWKLFP
jgi:dTDP-4-dehydrorhamnose 3,5-epimerase